MFVRVMREENNEITEVLVNVVTVWKIEVTYYEATDHGNYPVRSAAKMDDPTSVRFYKVFFGSDNVGLWSTDQSEAARIFAQIYDNSVR